MLRLLFVLCVLALPAQAVTVIERTGVVTGPGSWVAAPYGRWDGGESHKSGTSGQFRYEYTITSGLSIARDFEFYLNCARCNSSFSASIEREGGSPIKVANHTPDPRYDNYFFAGYVSGADGPLNPGEQIKIVVDMAGPFGSIWPNNASGSGFSFYVQTVPVPGAAGMLGLAVAGLVAARGRKRKLTPA